MTRQSANSEYVKDELHWALTNRTGRILPIMLEPTDPAAFHLRLMRIQYVDMTPQNADAVSDFRKSLQLIERGNDESTLPLNHRSMDSEKELISLLLTFISRYHQKHLRNLTAPRDSDHQAYVGGRSVRHELRELTDSGKQLAPHIR
jgi:hypothetical protein